jgi:hypothetical protein
MTTTTTIPSVKIISKLPTDYRDSIAVFPAFVSPYFTVEEKAQLDRVRADIRLGRVKFVCNGLMHSYYVVRNEVCWFRNNFPEAKSAYLKIHALLDAVILHDKRSAAAGIPALGMVIEHFKELNPGVKVMDDQECRIQWLTYLIDNN